MDRALTDIATGLVARLTGPLKFRMFLQPAMAAFFAVRAALTDVRNGRPPYFWAFMLDADERRELALEAWKDIGRVFILALAMDGIYQYIELRWIYPIDAILVALALAVVPYVVLRGIVTRLVRRHIRKDVRS
jgi:hypothetical protein